MISLGRVAWLLVFKITPAQYQLVIYQGFYQASLTLGGGRKARVHTLETKLVGKV